MKTVATEAEVLVIPLDKGKAMPLYIQVERYITDRIMAGDFDEGMPMPSPRVVAKRNAIAKNTVLTAYERMVAKGFLASLPSKWYYVCFPQQHRDMIMEKVSLRLMAESRPEWRYDLTQVLPSPIATERFRFGRRSPVDALPPGLPEWVVESAETALWHFEELLSRYINKEGGFAIRAGNLCVFGGQQHIFSHVATRLLRGRMVLVVCPCDLAIRRILEEQGVLPISINLHPGGNPLNVDQVHTLCKMLPISAIVLDRHYYHMTVGKMDGETLGQLHDLADEQEILLLEHTADRDLWFDEGDYPIFPAGKGLHAIHTFYLSNLLSPFCYFGIVVGPEAFIRELKHSRHHISMLPDDGLVGMAGELITRGGFRAQTGRLLRGYRELREEVCRSLAENLGAYTTFDMPPSGLSCWLTLSPGIDVAAAVENAREAGIRLEPQSGHHFDGIEDHNLLFGFAGLTAGRVDRVVSHLRHILEKSRP